MLIVVTLGFSQFKLNLMLCQPFSNFKPWLSVQSDWGGEYRNLHSYFQTHGITHRISCPHTHQKQGCVERKHRHLIDTTLALLAESHLPQKFWNEACLTSCYLINRLPTPLLQNKSPFETLSSTSGL
jgi:hypothetical protein